VISGVLLSVGFAVPLAKAVEPDEVLQDKALEARARHISEGLRCLVCQNQSIDDSAAPLARDLRLLVRERLKAGDTDQQIEDFIVARYSEFVLLKPHFAPHTLLLWFATPAVASDRAADRDSCLSEAVAFPEPEPLSAPEERRHFDLDGHNPSLAHGRISARTCRF
jgi:cytochrome c-type biogenesis protein CcmH